MSITTLREILENKKTVHLCGIGGISMRSLAIVLAKLGCTVQGSDRDASPVLAKLDKDGIKTFVGHSAANIVGAAMVIRTAAVPDDNCEITAAALAGIPVIERAEAWGVIMKDYENVVCIAGTHGKTSTTSMMACVALKADTDPTIMVGGELSAINGSMRIGGNNLFVAEACEYKNSYHKFSPTIAMILNVDLDHLDFFDGMEDIIASFRHFALQVPENTGLVVANYEDDNIKKVLEGVNRRVVTFGMSKEADVYCDFIKGNTGFYSFTIYNKGTFYCEVKLSVPGKHNVLNALATAAAAIELGISGESFKRGMQSYTGVDRRMEYKTTYNNALIFDDYAHHPQEIIATLSTADNMGDGRTICVFQPHTYTRMEALLDDFAQALAVADIVVLTEIFAAREQNTNNISSKQLADKIPNCKVIADFEGIADYLKSVAEPGDIIITMGAGDVYKVCDFF